MLKTERLCKAGWSGREELKLIASRFSRWDETQREKKIYIPWKIHMIIDAWCFVFTTIYHDSNDCNQMFDGKSFREHNRLPHIVK